jgi:multimeric flavodoxin WrbA
MNIVAIIGSNRKGNTSTMVNHAIKYIESRADVFPIFLGDLNFKPCDGCLQCDETGECHYNDDMAKIIDKIKAADGLIIASPARWGLMSGELKCFLDRLNPLAAPELLSGKKAVVFSVGQSNEEDDGAASIKSSCESVVTFCDNADIEVVDKVLAFGFLNSTDLDETNVFILDQCQRASINLLNSLES